MGILLQVGQGLVHEYIAELDLALVVDLLEHDHNGVRILTIGREGTVLGLIEQCSYAFVELVHIRSSCFRVACVLQLLMI